MFQPSGVIGVLVEIAAAGAMALALSDTGASSGYGCSWPVTNDLGRPDHTHSVRSQFVTGPRQPIPHQMGFFLPPSQI